MQRSFQPRPYTDSLMNLGELPSSSSSITRGIRSKPSITSFQVLTFYDCENAIDQSKMELWFKCCGIWLPWPLPNFIKGCERREWLGGILISDIWASMWPRPTFSGLVQLKEAASSPQIPSWNFPNPTLSRSPRLCDKAEGVQTKHLQGWTHSQILCLFCASGDFYIWS